MKTMELELKSGEIVTGLFTELRRKKVNPPLGYPYVYDLRHADDGDWIDPVTIEEFVVVNHCGTLFTKKPVPMVSLGKDDNLGAIIIEWGFID